MTTYKITIQFTEPCLGTAPADPEIYKSFIASKKAKADAKLPEAEKVALTEALAAEETPLLPPVDDKPLTVFRRKDGGLILMDFMIRGFLKEAATAISGVWGGNSKIDKWLFVKERYIPLLRGRKPITEADGQLERPLRAMTMQGPRVTLACSEMINAGATATFHLMVLPLGEKDRKMPITEELIRSWLDYMALCGIGQWRSGSYGRATYELTKM